jgi:hypothetical protein
MGLANARSPGRKLPLTGQTVSRQYSTTETVRLKAVILCKVCRFPSLALLIVSRVHAFHWRQVAVHRLRLSVVLETWFPTLMSLAL